MKWYLWADSFIIHFDISLLHFSSQSKSCSITLPLQILRSHSSLRRPIWNSTRPTFSWKDPKLWNLLCRAEQNSKKNKTKKKNKKLFKTQEFDRFISIVFFSFSNNMLFARIYIWTEVQKVASSIYEKIFYVPTWYLDCYCANKSLLSFIYLIKSNLLLIQKLYRWKC